MKVRIIAGMPEGAVLYDRPWPAEGSEIDDLPTTIAAHLVASGVAEEVADEPRPSARKSSRKGDGHG
ncbi:hypothetical protein PV735_31595 [Streptomyces turgidiscabies]|uniref:hypothetical protein n=1 Tax=Streptomyces turgidiscabies TaxID=85558 RepID=UPI0029B8821C|nr:hypothetical protein [Streptomyces turgidiscabies]MDX3497196.1 hypothetical protein [Streptomyces turgidiscabies]